MTLLESSITSVHNPRVKSWAQLLDKKGRDKQGQFIIEGVHLVQEALASGAAVETLIVASDRQQELPTGLLEQALAAGIECVAVSEQVLAKCTDTLAPQAVLAVLPKLRYEPRDLLAAAAPGLVVVIDGIQDPGNLGTIIRSADAVGATGVLLGRGTVDLYNPKTVRSTMGSLFHLPIVQGDLRDALPQAASAGAAIVTTSLQAKMSCYEYDFREPVWFVVGNEGQGVSEEVSLLATEQIIIPMQGRAESLNAAMAATVVLFEAMRQRGVS
ncbi:RNA methyltransferase [Paenibacillus doosanensis]|uniref:TrmH family RNA methyltransferase n=1 Tax=Paenibacillus doosanensis TaxID=1229154 RepID=UPI0021808195|nr:RNA methyltransferase [Paenibacillus doosanensis]MCS7461750.1 RNA methyltransferase [Paenibacillus doosanensis]